MYKNIVESDRPQMTIMRMSFAFWIPKATNKLSEYAVLIAFHCNSGNKHNSVSVDLNFRCPLQVCKTLHQFNQPALAGDCRPTNQSSTPDTSNAFAVLNNVQNAPNALSN
jgi:hypothetical protein